MGIETRWGDVCDTLKKILMLDGKLHFMGTKVFSNTKIPRFYDFC